MLTNKADATYKIQNSSFAGSSNTVNFEVITNLVTLTKTVTPTSGIQGDTVTFTIVLDNTNTTNNAINVILIDNLTSQGFTFVSGSTKINGISSTDSPITGINIGVITKNTSTTVTFQATIS